MKNYFLEITKASIEFPTPKGPFKALDGVNLGIQKGEFVSLIGHSGCGKSTVLNIVAGLYQATEGGVILEGKEVNEPGPERAVVFQNHSLLPWLTAYQNVELAVKQVFKNNKTKAENTRLVALKDELETKLDDAITTGSTGTQSELLKTRLEQVEQQQKTLNEKLAQVTSEQTRLAKLSDNLSEKQQTLDAQIQDIEISRQALQTRETNLLQDQDHLKQREKNLNEEALQLSSKENRLKLFETDLNEKKQALEDYYSKPWYSRMWDNVASKWREE